MGLLWIAYYILIGLAMVQSVLLVIQTWEHRRYSRSCINDMDRLRVNRRAAVLAPCKGVDIDLEENLRALLQQDHDNYEVTFIVESADDPACPVINRVMAEHPRRATRLLIAGRAVGIGQKTHNLRTGIAGLSEDVEILAFVDSDSRPRPQWLRLIVSRLSDANTMAVTGYRWFVPTRASVVNHMLYSLNCGVMALLGKQRHHLVWGGSWGIRRSAYDAIKLHEAWEGTLSDDLVASRQLRRANLRVQFEPACVVASPFVYSPCNALAFMRRQYLVGRFYAPVWWVFALSASTLSNMATLGSLAVLLACLATGSSFAWFSGGVVATLYAMSVVRGFIRQDLIGVHFPEREDQLRRPRRFDIWGGPLTSFVNWMALLTSAVGRHITWRDIRYRVLPDGQVEITRDDRPPVCGTVFSHAVAKGPHWSPKKPAPGDAATYKGVKS